MGSYQPNAFRLYDMHGNVRQWCQDWYDQNYYKNSPKQDPQGPEELARRVVRGGDWSHHANAGRSASRGSLEPEKRDNFTGFRVVAVQSGRVNKPESPGADAKPQDNALPAPSTKPAEDVKQITKTEEKPKGTEDIKALVATMEKDENSVARMKAAQKLGELKADGAVSA